MAKQTPVYIVRDTREKKGAWDFSDTKFCLGMIDKKLDTGDYSIKGMEDMVAIERKRTLCEIATNLREPRFKDCLKRLQQYKYKYIICEFSASDIANFPIGSGVPKKEWPNLKATGDYILRCLMQMQMEYQIQMLFCEDKDNAEIIAASVLKRIIERETIPCQD